MVGIWWHLRGESMRQGLALLLLQIAPTLSPVSLW